MSHGPGGLKGPVAGLVNDAGGGDRGAPCCAETVRCSASGTVRLNPNCHRINDVSPLSRLGTFGIIL